MSCNFFSLWISGRVDGLKPREAFKPWTAEEGDRRVRAWVQEGKDFAEFKRDPFLALQLFIRLEEAFGEDLLSRMVIAYGGARPENDADRIALMAEKLSELTKHDIAAVFQNWNIPVSGTAAAKCRRYPAAPASVMP